MNHNLLLNRAGIVVNSLNDQVEVFRTTSECRMRAARFEACQKRLMEHPPQKNAVSLANLCCFDAIDPTLFPGLVKAKTEISRWEGLVALDWFANSGALCRVALSNLTQLALHSSPLGEQSVDALLDWLADGQAFKGCKRSDLLQELRADQMAYCIYGLPMVLFSHVSNVRKMTPLPLGTLARIESGLVPVMPDVDVDAQIARQVTAADCVDALEQKAATGGGASPKFITMVLERLSVDSNLSSTAQVDAWLTGIAALSGTVRSTCIADVLVVEWIFDLIESGTVLKQERSSVNTRSTYARKAGLAIWRAVQAIEASPDSWEIEDIATLVETIKADPSVHYDQVFSAAIGSFLAFLHHAYDLPLVRAGEPDGPAAIPRAQYITDTEYQRACTWVLESTTLDPDMKSRVLAAMALLRYAPLRLKEALHLRLRNEDFTAAGLELEIQSWRGVLTLKSTAATRRVVINDEKAVSAIRSLFEIRQGNAGDLDNLLFGDINQPKSVSRKFTLHRLLLSVLKAATGDPTMTVHALRHSFCCDRMAEILSSDCVVDFSRVNHLMYAMGHATAATLVESYTHIYEFALRLHLDIQMLQFPISSEVAGRISGLSANTLRQRAARSSRPVSEVGWTAIADAATEVPWVKGVDRLELAAPRCPALVSSVSALLTPRKTLDAIELLAVGNLNELQIAQRLRISVDCVKSIARIARSLQGSAESKSAEVEWHSVDARLQALGIRFASVQHYKFAKLVESMDLAATLDPKSIAATGLAWMTMRSSRGYWDASNQRALLTVLQLLAKLKAQAGQFAICSTNEAKGITLAGQAHQVFQAAFSAPALKAPNVKCRSDRPDCFVSYPTPTADGPCFEAAATSTSGLDVLMFALTVYSKAIGGHHANS